MSAMGETNQSRRRGPSDELLCGCSNLTREDFVAEVARRPMASFDTLLDVTGSGRECTACMLDLEYLFTESPRDTSAAGPLTNGDAAKPVRQSMKRRLYEMLDRVPIMMPYNLTNWMPVLYGGGVSEYLWMANHRVLYDEAGSEADFKIRYRLRDDLGRTVFRERRVLEKDGNLRIDLSSKFPSASALSVGSIALDRYASRPTVRGTTRPQIEINCARSAASLHFQAAGPDQTSSIRIPWQPDTQRALFTIVNGGRRPYRVAFHYRADGDQNAPSLGEKECVIPRFGAAIHEVALSAAAAAALGGKFLQVNWQTRGLGKLHFICLARDGARLSIDHL